MPIPINDFDTIASGSGCCCSGANPPDNVHCDTCPDVDISRYHIRLNRIRWTNNPACLVDFDTSALFEATIDGQSGNAVGVTPPALASFPSKISGSPIPDLPLTNTCGTLHLTQWDAYIRCDCLSPSSTLRYAFYLDFITQGFVSNFGCGGCNGLQSPATILFTIGCSDECDIDTVLGDYEVSITDGTSTANYILDFTIYKV